MLLGCYNCHCHLSIAIAIIVRVVIVCVVIVLLNPFINSFDLFIPDVIVINLTAIVNAYYMNEDITIIIADLFINANSQKMMNNYRFYYYTVVSIYYYYLYFIYN